MKLYKLFLMIGLCLMLSAQASFATASTSKKPTRASQRGHHSAKPTPESAARNYLRSVSKILVEIDANLSSDNYYICPDPGCYRNTVEVNWLALGGEESKQWEREALRRWIEQKARPYFNRCAEAAKQRQNCYFSGWLKKVAKIVPKSAETESLHNQFKIIFGNAFAANNQYLCLSFLELTESVIVDDWLTWWNKNFTHHDQAFWIPFWKNDLRRLKAALEQLRIKYNILESEIR